MPLFAGGVGVGGGEKRVGGVRDRGVGHAEVARCAKKRDEAIGVWLIVAVVAIMPPPEAAVGEAHHVLLDAIPLELDHVVHDVRHFIDEGLPLGDETRRGVLGDEGIGFRLEFVALGGLSQHYAVVVGGDGRADGRNRCGTGVRAKVRDCGRRLLVHSGNLQLNDARCRMGKRSRRHNGCG